MTKENTELQDVNKAEDVVTDSSDGTENTAKDDDKQTQDNRIPYERFKQKVDEANALKEKLAEIEREQEAAKRKELEETEQYKELYEQAKAEAEATRQQALEIKRNTALALAGYNGEQASMLAKLVEGETEEEIAESIKTLQDTFPVADNYADPSAFNGAKSKPKTIDGEEVGRNAVSRVLHKIKL